MGDKAFRFRHWKDRTEHATKVRIVCDGITLNGAKIFLGSQELNGVTRIDFEPFVPGGLIKARITVLVDSIDVQAEAEIVERDPKAEDEVVRKSIKRELKKIVGRHGP